CMVLTEGFDLPELGCVVLARPTKSMGLFRQMIGRGLRAAAGKVDCIVLDHAGAVFEHGFAEDPVKWTLSADRRAENPVQRARVARTRPGLTTCPECRAVRIEGKACTQCGWAPKPKAAPVADGVLGRVDRSPAITSPIYTAEHRINFHRQLVWIARGRGYK